MEFEWDDAKQRANFAKHGLEFARVAECDWTMAVIVEDTSTDYGEPRLSALLPLDDRLYSLVFTPRKGVLRIISFRKANKRERLRYDRKRNLH